MRQQWTVWKEFRFEAAHKLEEHDGKCARLHGHSWVGRVYLTGNYLQAVGSKKEMLIDFGTVKEMLITPVVEQFLDHHYLNETLATNRPTSEMVAQFLFKFFEARLKELAATLKNVGADLVRVSAVEIEETCTSGCRYER